MHNVSQNKKLPEGRLRKYIKHVFWYCHISTHKVNTTFSSQTYLIGRVVSSCRETFILTLQLNQSDNVKSPWNLCYLLLWTFKVQTKISVFLPTFDWGRAWGRFNIGNRIPNLLSVNNLYLYTRENSLVLLGFLFIFILWFPWKYWDLFMSYIADSEVYYRGLSLDKRAKLYGSSATY